MGEKSLERCKRPVATADIKHGDIDLIFCLGVSTRITQNADPFWIVGYRRIGHARHDAAIHASTRGYEQACGIVVLEEHSEVECRHRDRTPYLIRHQAEKQHVKNSFTHMCMVVCIYIYGCALCVLRPPPPWYGSQIQGPGPQGRRAGRVLLLHLGSTDPRKQGPGAALGPQEPPLREGPCRVYEGEYNVSSAFHRVYKGF